MIELVETQNEIIRMETEIIDALYLLLLQHVEVSELTGPLAEMEEVARLKRLIE